MGVSHLLAALPVVFEGRIMPEVVVIGAEIGVTTPFTDKLKPPLELALERVMSLVQSECMSQVS
jgi:hypothetical protein